MELIIPNNNVIWVHTKVDNVIIQTSENGIMHGNLGITKLGGSNCL